MQKLYWRQLPFVIEKWLDNLDQIDKLLAQVDNERALNPRNGI